MNRTRAQFEIGKIRGKAAAYRPGVAAAVREVFQVAGNHLADRGYLLAYAQGFQAGVHEETNNWYPEY